MQGEARLIPNQADFNNALSNAAQHIQTGCLDNPQHLYIMDANGSPLIARGTNRIENYHRELNDVIPNQCGFEYASAALQLFNFTRNRRMGCLHKVSA